MEKVKFRVTEICDPVKQGSEIALYGEYLGEFSVDKRIVYYTDKVGTDWGFWVNDTCEIIND